MLTFNEPTLRSKPDTFCINSCFSLSADLNAAFQPEISTSNSSTRFWRDALSDTIFLNRAVQGSGSNYDIHD